MTNYINPNDYDDYRDYLDACMQREINGGADPEKARFDRSMMEWGNGEEWEGQYGGKPGY